MGRIVKAALVPPNLTKHELNRALNSDFTERWREALQRAYPNSFPRVCSSSAFALTEAFNKFFKHGFARFVHGIYLPDAEARKDADQYFTELETMGGKLIVDATHYPILCLTQRMEGFARVILVATPREAEEKGLFEIKTGKFLPLPQEGMERLHRLTDFAAGEMGKAFRAERIDPFTEPLVR